jgi:UDPglucose 6-dehydrogenase
MDPRVAVIGLGKLGACMAAVFADAGFDTIGADVRPEVVDAINAGTPPPGVVEDGLAELLAAVPVAAVDSAIDAAARADVVFVVVPTPSGSDDRFDSRFVVDAVRDVCVGLKQGTRSTQPVIVITSTVMPGTCGADVTDVILAAGFTPGADIGLVYSPEFIALGSVIRDLRNPDVVYIGTDHDWVVDAVAPVFAAVGPNAPRLHLSLVDAEVAKLATNVYLSVKVGFANEVARVAEALPGADAAAVCAAIGADSRVGARYLRPGGSIGGPCLPRDTRAWSAMTRFCGRDPSPFAEAAQRSDADVLDWVLCAVEAIDGRPLFVTVCGLAYKPGTGIVDDALGWLVASALVSSERRVAVHDDIVAAIPPGCTRAGHMLSVLETSDVVVVTHPGDRYGTMLDGVPDDWVGPVIIDVWGSVRDPAGRRRIIRPGTTTTG